MSSLYLSLVLMEILQISLIECEHDCFVDDKVQYDDMRNVYQCKDDQKCCIEFTKASCCHSKPVLQIFREQLSIWGTLFGILFAICLIVYCRKKDFNYVKYLKRWLINCCCGRQPTNDDQTETKTIVAKDVADSRV